MLKSFENAKMKGMPKLSPCEEGFEGASRSKLKHLIIIAKMCALCCWWASETYQACPSWESSCQYADLQVFCSYNPQKQLSASPFTPPIEHLSLENFEGKIQATYSPRIIKVAMLEWKMFGIFWAPLTSELCAWLSGYELSPGILKKLSSE